MTWSPWKKRSTSWTALALLADIRESLAELSTTDAAALSKEDALRLISGQ